LGTTVLTIAIILPEWYSILYVVANFKSIILVLVFIVFLKENEAGKLRHNAHKILTTLIFKNTSHSGGSGLWGFTTFIKMDANKVNEW
jgi:hypothetical protein